MTIEEFYSLARLAEFERASHNTRHLADLKRLEAAEATKRAEVAEQSRRALELLRRSAG